MDKPCPKCSDTRYLLELQSSGPHYAKRLCRGCLAFVGWHPKPKTEAVEKTAVSSGLTVWELQDKAIYLRAEVRKLIGQVNFYNGHLARLKRQAGTDAPTASPVPLSPSP